MTPTILLVEDEPRLADVLEAYLRREGFRVERAADGPSAVERWRSTRPDLVLLDLMLPGFDGLEVARRIRAEAPTPIVMLTARDRQPDKLEGLDLGADDFITKPFFPPEVVARVRAVLRRASSPIPAGTDEKPVANLRVGRLELDPVRLTASCGGQSLELTLAELRMLERLAATPGRLWRRDELLAATGSSDRPAHERTADAHVKNLRRKLGPCGALLETVRGLGYRLRDEPAASRRS